MVKSSNALFFRANLSQCNIVMVLTGSTKGRLLMVMLIFSMENIFRRNGKDGTRFGFYVDLSVFLKAIDEIVNKSMNAEKVHSKQEKKGKRYSL